MLHVFILIKTYLGQEYFLTIIVVGNVYVKFFDINATVATLLPRYSL